MSGTVSKGHDLSYEAGCARRRLREYQSRIADGVAEDPSEYFGRVSRGLAIQASKEKPTSAGEPMLNQSSDRDYPDHEAHRSPWIESWWFLTTFVVVAILLITIAQARI